jgi:hypothetical protein
MADKQVKVRIAMDGGKAVEAQLQGIGQKGNASMQALSRSSGEARANLQNAGYQVQDFFVQVADGTDPTRALAQQLPQLLSGMGLFGILAGTAAAALVPLAGVLFNMGEESVTAEERVNTLREAVTALNQATAAANADPLDMLVQYGIGAEQAREVLEIERQIAQVRAERALFETGKTLGGMGLEGIATQVANVADLEAQYASLYEQIQAVEDASSEEGQAALQRLAEQRGEVGKLIDQYYTGMEGYRDQMRSLSESLGIAFEGNEEALLSINEAMLELAQADTIDGQATAAANLRNALFEASDGGRLLNEEGAKLLDGLTDAELAALALSQVDIAGGINAAASSAAALARELGVSVALASQMMAAGYTGKKAEVIFDPRDPRFDSVVAEASRFGESAGTVSPFDDSRLPRPARMGGGGGGAQKAQNDLMREAQRLYEQTRTDAEKYTEEVGKLDQLLQSGIIDQELYNRGLARAAEQYGEASGAAALFKDMNIDLKETMIDVFMRGSDALDGLIEKLKRAAIEAALFGSGPIANLFGMTGGGLLGGGLSFLSGALANGGPVQRGKAYLVGESGPEYFVPNANGKILPIDPMSERSPSFAGGGRTAAGAGQGGGDVAVKTQVEVVPSKYFDVVVAQIAARGDAATAAAQRRAMPSQIRDAQARGRK